MKIYTKTGDKGITSLIGGKRVPKYHLRIEAYGTIDELTSYIGLIRNQEINIKFRADLLKIQDRLMACAAILATDCEDCKVKIPELDDKDIEMLEKEMDIMNTDLPILKAFILPGGNTLVAYCHIARTVCRRAERIIIRLSEELFVPENVLKYINRLSDYLFILARKLGKDLNIEEIQWQPWL
jgi:cob(I)alamin adenosyltransferase